MLLGNVGWNLVHTQVLMDIQALMGIMVHILVLLDILAVMDIQKEIMVWKMNNLS